MCGEIKSDLLICLASIIFYCYKRFSLKLNEIIGGNCNGSPTAISFLQLNLDIGSKL